MKGSVIWVEADKCLACKACEVECALAHCAAESLLEAVANDLRPSTRVDVVDVGERASLPVQCRHCEDAPCVLVCPSGALEKLGPEMAVVLHQDKCVGCKSCVLVCPFGAITVAADGRAMVKCDLCAERAGAEGQPACVAACPTRALHFGTPNEVAKEARRRSARQYLEAILAEEPS